MYGDMEWALARGKGLWACEGGWEVSTEYSQARLHAQFGLMDPISSNGAGLSISLNNCRLVLAYCPHRSAAICYELNEWVESLCLLFGNYFLTVSLLALGPNISASYPTCLDSLSRGTGCYFNVQQRDWHASTVRPGRVWLTTLILTEMNPGETRTLPRHFQEALGTSLLCRLSLISVFWPLGWREELSFRLKLTGTEFKLTFFLNS